MKTFVMLLSHELCWCRSSTETIPGAQVLGVGCVEWYPRARFRNILRSYGESTSVAEPRNMLLSLLWKERSEVALGLKPQWEGNKAYRKNKSRKPSGAIRRKQACVPSNWRKAGMRPQVDRAQTSGTTYFKKVDWSQIGNMGSLKQWQ